MERPSSSSQARPCAFLRVKISVLERSFRMLFAGNTQEARQASESRKGATEQPDTTVSVDMSSGLVQHDLIRQRPRDGGPRDAGGVAPYSPGGDTRGESGRV